jgi:HTH-type transcriptional regulator, competence development regulator
MDFGSRIRKSRVDKGISLREFAKQVGIDFTYLSKIENGKVDPPSEKWIRIIARELGEKEEELLELAGNFSPDKMRKAIEEQPELGRLLRKISTRRLTQDQVRGMLRIVSEKEDLGAQKKNDNDQGDDVHS